MPQQMQIQCLCDRASCTFPGNYRRQKTAYHDDALNFRTLCFAHQLEEDEYWEERWAGYYNDINPYY